ncbi:hypothetical protein BD626DRAFT_120093 [Schizophyllum amplum]|uniref:Uncharacterized protein n=1 Tax=Schizophyllum amplum TaxID=97359 RepID=A0A550CV96_9AGAR|nr:hypothetical protein BD626DRAFT_120093 [Auriculariopsis ampla]
MTTARYFSLSPSLNTDCHDRKCIERRREHCYMRHDDLCRPPISHRIPVLSHLSPLANMSQSTEDAQQLFQDIDNLHLTARYYVDTLLHTRPTIKKEKKPENRLHTRPTIKKEKKPENRLNEVPKICRHCQPSTTRRYEHTPIRRLDSFRSAPATTTPMLSRRWTRAHSSLPQPVSGVLKESRCPGSIHDEPSR